MIEKWDGKYKGNSKHDGGMYEKNFRKGMTAEEIKGIYCGIEITLKPSRDGMD